MSDNLFPDEILAEILRRLPPKKISHGVLPSSPSTTATPPPFSSLATLSTVTTPSSPTPPPCPFPSSTISFSPPSLPSVTASATKGYQSVIIYNPCVRRFISLPSPCNYGYDYSSCFGFGFDSRNSDYKLVRIACNDEGYVNQDES
ncbi:hypothetical protein JHK84_028940 [Glycine max]|nr:hypothetical protein JHK85_029356 [Glycine max]KAG5152468.1 hypothetical protein JHK84_028940 [Glycine max]